MFTFLKRNRIHKNALQHSSKKKNNELHIKRVWRMWARAHLIAFHLIKRLDAVQMNVLQSGCYSIVIDSQK